MSSCIVGMGKRKVALLRLVFQGTPLAKILAWTTSRKETVVKPLGQPSIHLSAYATARNELQRHIKDESAEDGRYTRQAVVPPEKVILLFLAALGPEDDPPPKVRSFSDMEDARLVGKWLTRVWPKVTRKAESRPIRILKGPPMELANLISSVRSGELPRKQTVDLASILEYYASGIDSDEVYEVATETDLVRGDSRLAFSENLEKLILCVDEGVVLELDPNRLISAVMDTSELLGVDDLFDAIRQKGYAFVDERGIKALEEWKKERR